MQNLALKVIDVSSDHKMHENFVRYFSGTKIYFMFCEIQYSAPCVFSV